MPVEGERSNTNGPSSDPAALLANYAQAKDRQASEELERLTRSYDDRLRNMALDYERKYDQALTELRNSIRDEARRQVMPIVAVVIGALVLAFLAYATTQLTAMHSQVSNFQSAVMGLQKEVLAAQNNIQQSSEKLAEKTSLLAAANTELDAATRRLEQTHALYEARLENLNQAGKK